MCYNNIAVLKKRKNIRRSIEVVITGLTRNQLYGNVPWVRIPPSPPAPKQTAFYEDLAQQGLLFQLSISALFRKKRKSLFAIYYAPAARLFIFASFVCLRRLFMLRKKVTGALTPLRLLLPQKRKSFLGIYAASPCFFILAKFALFLRMNT